MNINLSICFPFAGRYVAPQWSVAMQTMYPPMNCNHTVITSYGMKRDNARNGLVQKALEIGSKYILFVDDDTNPINPTEALGLLMYEMDNSPEDVAAIGGVYVTKSMPAVPTILKEEGNGPFWKWRLGEVFPVFAIGTGFMMIRADAIRKIPYPWFADVNDVREAKDLGLMPTDKDKGPIQRFQMTDDVYFCRKLRENGYKVMAHGGVLCQHWDERGQVYELPRDSWPYLGRERKTFSPEVEISHELEALRKQHPYPEERPQVNLAEYPDFASKDVIDSIRGLVPPDAKCIVELGTWAGHGAARLADAAPQAQIICIDHWQGSREHWADENLRARLPYLYRAFVANTWSLSHRMIPIKSVTLIGMQEIASCGIRPDLIYVDASHEYEEVKRDVETARRLFPDAILCGDDWNWDGVHRAVSEALGEENITALDGRTWVYRRPSVEGESVESTEKESVAA